jgi:hypothetical protein
MKTRINAGLEKGEVEKIEYEFKGSKRFRERIIEILEKDIQGLYNDMLAEEIYDPNFALSQASRLGEIRAKKSLISLLE